MTITKTGNTIRITNANGVLVTSVNTTLELDFLKSELERLTRVHTSADFVNPETTAVKTLVGITKIGKMAS